MLFRSGEGKHQLILHKVKMEDMGNVTAKTPSNKGSEMLESKSNFTVVKGEEAPVMGDCGPVNGIAKKQCAMTIPYKVGKNISPNSQLKHLVRLRERSSLSWRSLLRVPMVKFSRWVRMLT